MTHNAFYSSIIDFITLKKTTSEKVFFLSLSMLKSPSVTIKPSETSIYFNKFIRFVRIGAFLHIMG